MKAVHMLPSGEASKATAMVCALRRPVTCQ